MTKPKQRNGNGFFKLVNKCASDFYLLALDDEIKEMFEYSISRASEAYNIAVFAKCLQPNQIELFVGERDMTSDLSAFKQSISANLTMGVNKKYNRQGSIWANSEFKETQLHSIAALEEAIVSIITSPVAAGLVASPSHFPGVVTTPQQLGTRLKTCQRPKLFGKKSTQPMTAELILEIPEPLSKKSPIEFRNQIARLTRKRIRAIAKERRKKNLGLFLGEQTVLDMRIDQRPIDYGLTEEIRTKAEIRVQAIEDNSLEKEFWSANYRRFLKKYRTSFQSWQTDKTVSFPHGTYKMHKIHNVQLN